MAIIEPTGSHNTVGTLVTRIKSGVGTNVDSMCGNISGFTSTPKKILILVFSSSMNKNCKQPY